MRDQKVHLPVSVAKKAFLQELSYYGFVDIPANAIEMTNLTLESGAQIQKWGTELKDRTSQYNEQITNLEAEITNVKKTIKYEEYAYILCQMGGSHGDSFKLESHTDEMHALRNVLYHGVGGRAAIDNLNEALLRYGLKYESVQHSLSSVVDEQVGSDEL